MRSNKRAPLSAKLEVLKACVVLSALHNWHNCEAFGRKTPKDLEIQYVKLIKSTLGVRQNTPKLLVLIETGLLPLNAIILSRQVSLNVSQKLQSVPKTDGG